MNTQTCTIQLEPVSHDDLNLVSENFQNLYPIFFQVDADSKNFPIAPSLWGDHLYHTKIGWKGRLLSFIYGVIAVFAGDSFKKRRLAEVIKRTNEVYHRVEQQLQPFLENYQEYLVEKFAGTMEPFENLENKLDGSRREIKQFYEATRPISKLFYQADHLKPKFLPRLKKEKKQLVQDRVQQFINKFFPEKEKTIFYQEKSYQEIGKNIHLIALEGIYRDSLPLSYLASVSMLYDLKNDLSREGGKQIRRWTKKLNHNQLDIRQLNKALHAIVEIVKMHHPSKKRRENANVSNIELAMIIQNAKNVKGNQNFSFTRPDAKHLKWRERLAEGDEFFYENEEGQLVQAFLGKPLSCRAHGTDEHLVFEIKDKLNYIDNERVLVIGINRDCLKLEEIAKENQAWGIGSSKFLYQDPKGRFALKEKLLIPLNSLLLTENSFKLAEPIRNWINWLMDREYTPTNLSKKYLFYSKEGELKTSKGCYKEKFNIMALENFAFECADQENLELYQYLVAPIFNHRKSKQYKQFFHDVVEKALEEDEEKPSDFGARKEISDPGIIHRAEKLRKEVIQLKSNCCRAIEINYRVQNSKHFQEVINEIILSTYDQLRTFGRIWKGLFSPSDLVKLIEQKCTKETLQLKY